MVGLILSQPAPRAQTIELTPGLTPDTMADVSEPGYWPVQRAVQALAATPWGAAAVAPVLHRADRVVFRWTGGRWMLTTALTGLPIAIVTTTGARSGLPRILPLACVRVNPGDRTFALIGTNFGRSHAPGWYYNLKANPRARVIVDGQCTDYVAHEAHDAEYDLFWAAAVRTYAGFRVYRARIRGRPIPIMVMTGLT